MTIPLPEPAHDDRVQIRHVIDVLVFQFQVSITIYTTLHVTILLHTSHLGLSIVERNSVTKYHGETRGHQASKKQLDCAVVKREV